MRHRPARSSARRRQLARAAIAGALAVPVLAAPALAQTVEATGTGQATVRVSGTLTQAKIAAAVAKAKALAVPRAFINAKTQAGLYAQASGLVLGAVQSVEEPPVSPYGYGYGIVFATGRFGPNKYCGKVTTVKRRLVNGRRRVVARHSRFRCFKPEIMTASLYVAFDASPAPPAS